MSFTITIKWQEELKETMSYDYGRALSDLALALARLQVRVNKLSPVQFSEIEQCEYEFTQIANSMRSVSTQFASDSPEKQTQAQEQFPVLVDTIYTYVKQIANDIHDKKWLIRFGEDALRFITVFIEVANQLLNLFITTSKILIDVKRLLP